MKGNALLDCMMTTNINYWTNSIIMNLALSGQNIRVQEHRKLNF